MSESSGKSPVVSNEWPDSLDALVAAPDHHKLLFENEKTRVLDTCIKPGDRTPVHTHRWPAVLYVLSWSQFIRYDDKGNVLVDSRNVAAYQNPPPAVWTDPLTPHSLLNVGQQDLRVINFEIKD